MYTRAQYDARHRYANSEKGKRLRDISLEYFINTTSDILNIDGNLRGLYYTMTTEIKMLSQGKLTGFKC